MSTPGGYTTFFNLILPTVGGNAVDWATWTNQNWQSVDAALQTLTDGKLSLNPVDGTLYGRMNGEWVQIEVDGSTVTVGIGEAPNDGDPYLRQSESWVMAEPIIEAIVETAIADAPLRIFRNVTAASIGPSGAYVFDESIANSQFNGHDIRFRVSGYYTASSDSDRLLNFDILFGVTSMFASDFLVDAVPAGDTVPFVIEGVLSSLSTSAQALSGTFTVGTHDPAASPADPPTSLHTAFRGTAAISTMGAGTNNFAMIVARLDSGGGAALEVTHTTLFLE